MNKNIKINYLSIIVLISASMFFLYDIIIDSLNKKDNYAHIIVEGMIFISISIVLFNELKRAYKFHLEVILEKEKVSILSGELHEIILKKFQEWGLSDSEKDIAILIIKGCSMKEISEMRNVKEKTIRQQATSIYNKTGLSGRNELAAYFIEDLLNIEKS